MDGPRGRFRWLQGGMQGLSQIAQTIAGGRCEAVSVRGLLHAVERNHGPSPAEESFMQTNGCRNVFRRRSPDGWSREEAL